MGGVACDPPSPRRFARGISTLTGSTELRAREPASTVGGIGKARRRRKVYSSRIVHQDQRPVARDAYVNATAPL